MGIVIRQSIITTIISYCGVIIGYINLLYLYPKFLDPEQIGLMRTIMDAAILFSPFAQFGLTQSILRYYPKFATNKKTSGSFISLMLLFAIAGFLVFLIVFKIFESPLLSYFEDNAKEIISYSTLVLWLTLILLVLAVLEAYSRSLLKMVVPNLLRELVARLLLAVFVLLYFSGALTFNQFIISTAVAYLICLVILIIYLSATGHLRVSFSFQDTDKAQLPGILKYSLLSFAGTAALIIVGKVDSIMVSGMMGFAANAVYTTAFYMATVIEVPKRALSQLAMPLISRAFEKKDMADIKAIYQKTSINQFIIGSLVLISVWINLENIFALMPRGEIYEAGKFVVLIIGVGKLIDMLFGPNSEIIVLSKYYSFNIILVMFFAFAIVVTNNLLIPRYGIEGAAFGSALALIGFNLAKYIFVYLKLNLQPFSFATLKVAGIVATTVLANYFIPRVDNIFLDIIVRSAGITVLFGSLIFFAKVSPDGNNLVEKSLTLLGIRLK